MTGTLETIYFSYIIRNRELFDLVPPVYFKNDTLRTIYKPLRDYLQKYQEAEFPKAKQIWEMVNLYDKDNVVGKEAFKQVFASKLEEQYDIEHFVKPQFEGWVTVNRIDEGTSDIIEITRDITHETDFNKIQEKKDEIKAIADRMTASEFLDDGEDLGSDFDNVDDHNQDVYNLKVRTGIECLDGMIGGGLDIGLTVIAGATNSGKSIWLQNIAVKAADLGTNVLYITLEMSERKTMKRLGAMRLLIPSSEYDTVSMDREYMDKKIKNLYAVKGKNIDLFGEEHELGKITVKYWNAGTATVNDFDAFIRKCEAKKGIKFGLIVVDYLTLVALPKNQANENIFMKGKIISESLRSLGHTHGCPVLTAVQIGKEGWGSTTSSLGSISESKGISECADLVLGIIRSEEMQRENLYRLKMLKQRDGNFLRSQFMINLNPIYLYFENDKYVDANALM